MCEVGIDISVHQSKSVNQFSGEHFYYVITVSDNAKIVVLFVLHQRRRPMPWTVLLLTLLSSYHSFSSAPCSRGHGEMGKAPARWRHGGLLLCPSADAHPSGLRSPQETNRRAKFLGSPAKRQPLALASRPHSPFGAPRENGRRKGEKTNDRANQTDQSRSI